MTKFKLHPTLINDCHQLHENKKIIILLHKNAVVPWIIIVPKTLITELHQLPKAQYLDFYQDIKILSKWLKGEYQAHKINTGCIGNIVSQLHFHIIARYKNDCCWPQPIWGNLQKHNDYKKDKIIELTYKINQLKII